MDRLRVRFAPSPTGFLHIGGARTALFNWLFARRHGGVFVLRIEDTDASRNSQAAVEIILKGLRWLGLDWDEGPVTGDPDGAVRGECGPYFQSRRGAIYRRRVDELKAKGLAYDFEGAVKFRMPREPIVIPDLVAGDVQREPTDREALDPDFFIVRSDGQPVFHLVNVVDDLEMGITHVIRGEDHLSNTPKHIALFRAFGADPPRYGHIPLILNADGSKMSKRDLGSTLDVYMDGGYVPAAVVNYLCLLGWSPKNDRELLTRDEAAAMFDLAGVLRHNARFDPVKLQWMNMEYLKRLTAAEYADLAAPALAQAEVSVAGFERGYVERALATCREKVKVLKDLAPFCDFYFQEEVRLDPDGLRKSFEAASAAKIEELAERLRRLELFDAASIEGVFRQAAAHLGVKVGALVHPIRFACTGRTIGPSLYHLMEVLGRDRVLSRLSAALRALHQATEGVQ